MGEFWKTNVAPIVTTLAAIALAAVFLWWSWEFYAEFALKAPPAGSSWERAAMIYNGIASVGFTAIGVLLGTQVQLANVARAREEATSAKASAERTKEVIKQGIKDTTPTPGDLGGGPPTQSEQLAAQRLKRIHDQLIEGLAK